MAFTRDKVFDTVSRRRMHYAGTGVGGHVIAKKYRRRTLVARMRGRQRMMEAQFAQGLTWHRSENIAFQFVGLEAGFDTIGREYQQAARRIDQAITDLGI